MHELIITRILNRGVVTLSELEDRATQRGLSLSDLYVALDKVHRDKRIVRKVLRGEVTYVPAPKRSEVVNSHVTWFKENYPPMTLENDGSGIDLDLSWMFLKTKEERDEYKALASGKPIWQVKKTKYS